MKIFLVGALFCLLAKSALAGLILDQSFIPTGTLGSSISNQGIQAQSFTVGVDGKLARVDLYVHLFFADLGPLPADGLTFNLLETDADGVPLYANSLASVSIASSSLPSEANSFITLDLMGFNLQVFEGDILALSLESELDRSLSSFLPGYSWGIAPHDPYPGGNLFISHDFGSTFLATGSPAGTGDVGFRTYISVSEPSIFFVFGLGLMFLVLQRKAIAIKLNESN